MRSNMITYDALQNVSKWLSIAEKWQIYNSDAKKYLKKELLSCLFLEQSISDILIYSATWFRRGISTWLTNRFYHLVQGVKYEIKTVYWTTSANLH